MLFERQCPGCGKPAPAVCAGCVDGLTAARSRSIDGVDRVGSLYEYDPLVARIVVAAKNGGRRSLLTGFGRPLADLVGPGVEAVTWIPASTLHRRARGYDQGRLLARAVAAALGVPARRLLERTAAETQHGRDRAHRLAGASLRPLRPVSGRLLIVDDVVTTGASLRHGALALRAAGATEVNAVTIASVGGPPT